MAATGSAKKCSQSIVHTCFAGINADKYRKKIMTKQEPFLSTFFYFLLQNSFFLSSLNFFKEENGNENDIYIGIWKSEYERLSRQQTFFTTVKTTIGRTILFQCKQVLSPNSKLWDTTLEIHF